jgi:hypothetical protein
MRRVFVLLFSLSTRWLLSVSLLALFCLPASGQTFVVADEDFQNDVEAADIGQGSGGGGPTTLGPPADDVGQPGQWVLNGYTNPPAGTGGDPDGGVADDTNQNFATGSITAAQNATLVPSPFHTVEKADPIVDDLHGYFLSNPNAQSMDGILKFSDASHTPVVATVGQRVRGEFQVMLDAGGLTFALVDSITDLTTEQAAHTWDGTTPQIRPGISSKQSGGDYFDGITGQISYNTQNGNEWYAVTDDGAGQVTGALLEDDFLKTFGIPPNSNTRWQRIAFEYIVGSSVYSKFSVSYLDFLENNVITNEVKLAAGGDIPVTSGTPSTSIEGIVFSGSDGGNGSYFLDEIYIEVESVNLWAGNFANQWHDTGNWLAAAIPNSNSDSVIFDQVTGQATTVTADLPVTVKRITFDTADTFALAGTATFTLDADVGDAAVEVLAGTHKMQAVVDMQVNTTADVAAGAVLEFNNDLNLNGNTLTKTGAGELALNNVVNASGGSLACNEGTCSGTLLLAGSLANAAVVSPGEGTGALAVAGDYSQSAAGTLLLEIGEEQNDLLAIGGDLSAGGELEVVLVGGFQPDDGDTFDVLDFSSLSGQFSLDLPGLSAGLMWDASSLYSTGQLAVTAVPEPATALLVITCLGIRWRRRLATSSVAVRR